MCEIDHLRSTLSHLGCRVCVVGRRHDNTATSPDSGTLFLIDGDKATPDWLTAILSDRSTISIVLTRQPPSAVNRIRWLESGADECLSISDERLISLRAKRLLSRSPWMNKRLSLKHGWYYEYATRRLHRTEESWIEFTTRESQIFELLVQSSEHVVLRDDLVEAVYGLHGTGRDQRLNAMMVSIRRKLRKSGLGIEISTYSKAGYCLFFRNETSLTH